MGVPASDYEARLLAVQAPANALRDEGSTLAYARAFGVEFDLASCVDRVSRRLAESAGQAATLQCETFVNPGPALKDFRTQLERASERAQGMIAVAGTRPPAAVISPQTAARCQAQPGAAALAVPGSVSGTLSSRSAAYAIRWTGPEHSDRPAGGRLRRGLAALTTGSCGRTILSDDDGGEGTNSRISWTAPASGEQVVVVTSVDGQGRGGYTLAVSTDSGATRDQRPGAGDAPVLRAVGEEGDR